MTRPFIFRLFVLALLLIIMIRPVVSKPEKLTSPAFGILIDRSKSMSVTDPARRLDVATQIASAIKKKFSSAQLYSFAETGKELSVADIPNLKADGTKTDIAKGLDAVFSKNAPGSAVVITDGRHIGASDPVSKAVQLGHPLFVIGVGNSQLFKDVAVRRVQGSPFSFKNIPATLSAQITLSGYARRPILVRLRDGGKMLAQQTVTAQTNEEEKIVTFTFTPDSIGSKVYVVEAETQPGEMTASNNRKEIAMDVGRDRFRVLYICGEPGPEYGFLRHQFKSDPGVELVTFVILRNASNVFNLPDSELSLIPFPTQDVLINQMSTFDLVVLEEFAYWQFGLSPQLLQAVRRRVEQGGSFLVTGGATVFSAGSGYAVPGAGEMIPLEFSSNEIKKSAEPLRLHVNAPSHPIFHIDDNPKRNAALWAAAPMLDDVSLVPNAKAGALVLASVAQGGHDYPVLTVWPFGRGRVAAFTSRTTWRWAMLAGDNGYEPQLYQTFWKNMVLWLTRSAEYKTIRMALEDKNVKLGDSGVVRVWVYDDYFKPLSDADVKIQVTYADNSRDTVTAEREAAGVYEATLKGTVMGPVAAQAWVTREGKRYGDDKIHFQIVENQIEEEDLRPDFKLMNELADSTGGKFVPAADFSPDMIDDFQKGSSEKAARKILIWNSPWVLALFLLFLLSEWILRKKAGLS